MIELITKDGKFAVRLDVIDSEVYSDNIVPQFVIHWAHLVMSDRDVPPINSDEILKGEWAFIMGAIPADKVPRPKYNLSVEAFKTVDEAKTFATELLESVKIVPDGHVYNEWLIQPIDYMASRLMHDPHVEVERNNSKIFRLRVYGYNDVGRLREFRIEYKYGTITIEKALEVAADKSSAHCCEDLSEHLVEVLNKLPLNEMVAFNRKSRGEDN